MFANNNYFTKNERHVLMGSYFFTHLLFIGFWYMWCGII